MRVPKVARYAIIVALEVCVGVALAALGQLASNTSSLLLIMLLISVGMLGFFFGGREVQSAALVLYGLTLTTSLSFSPFSYLYDFRVRYVVSYWSVTPSDVVLVFLVASALARTRRTRASAIGRRDFVLPLMFLLVHAVSVIPAVNKAAAVFATLRILKFLFVYWYFSRALGGMRQVRAWTAGLSIGVCLQLVVAVAQRLSNGYLGLKVLGEVPTSMRLREVGDSLTASPAGLFQHSADLALFSLLLLCVLLALRWDSQAQKFVNGVLVAAILAIQVLAASRTVLAISIVSIYAAIVLRNRSKVSNRTVSQVMLVSVPLMGLGVVLWDTISPILLHSDLATQYQNRLLQWALGLNEIAKSWLLGYGANNYADHMATAYPALYPTSFFLQNPIHNTYLQYWFDLGIAGLVIMLCLYVGAVLRGLKYLGMGANPEIGAMAVLVIGALLLYYFTGWSGLKEPMICFFWIVSGLVHNESLRRASTGVRG